MEVRDLNALIPLKPGQIRGSHRTEPAKRDMTVGELREQLKNFPDHLRIGFKIARHARRFHPILAAHLKALDQAGLMIHILEAKDGNECVLLLTDYETPHIPEKKKHA